jgi:hypothetical protein
MKAAAQWFALMLAALAVTPAAANPIDTTLTLTGAPMTYDQQPAKADEQRNW